MAAGNGVSGAAHGLADVVSHRMEWWSVLGLLSSSCCVLQLLLNVFSLGCAGFNTWLGPLRPLMLAITVSLQASMWRVALTGRGERLLVSATGATTVTAVLSLLPELLGFCWCYGRYWISFSEVPIRA
jgi:hypothetical protein